MTSSVDPLAPLERAAIAEEVASVVRHDLCNKFSSIRNAAYFIKRKTQQSGVWESTPRLSQMSKIIDDEIDAADHLITSRLNLSQLFAKNVSEVPIGLCVDQAVKWARIPSEAKIAVHAEKAMLKADPLEVALAIRCLVENAVEAMGGTGLVELHGTTERLPDVETQSSECGYWVIISDHGPGIVEAERSRIFHAFYTTKAGHAGLGLNMTRRIASRYGGELLLRPSDRGACLALSLPLATGSTKEGS